MYKKEMGDSGLNNFKGPTPRTEINKNITRCIMSNRKINYKAYLETGEHEFKILREPTVILSWVGCKGSGDESSILDL